MHISTFHSIKDPIVGHRFAYCTLAENPSPNGVLAHVAFFNATTMTFGAGMVLIKQGEMPSSDDILSLYLERTFTTLERDEVADELSLALTTEARKRATGYVRQNIKELCTDVVDWHDKGLLAPNPAIGRLRKICSDYIGMDEALQEAERLVSLEAMKYVIKN